MNVLFYRYGSICEPDMMNAFKQAGLTVFEDTTELTKKSLSDADRAASVDAYLHREKPLFVFSINFYPVIADVCHIYRVPYVCWTVDSPVPELFSTSILHDTNRIFLFDHAQYERFHAYNPNCIFYLPLASAVDRFNTVILAAPKTDYLYDISFVGSLYSEKSPLKNMQLPDYSAGYIHALEEAALKLYGYNPIEEALNDHIVSDIKANDPSFYHLKNTVSDMDSYVAAHSYIGYEASEKERIRTLNLLANYFQVDLFTNSDISPLKKVHTHGSVQTLTEMPLIFNRSKINLNMTIKPIQTGLPLRIFDILGCGGFLMTNYQSELAEYFDIGVDLEAYSSMEELVDKCEFYLSHEEERIQIASNGYHKVMSMHTYPHRVRDMIGQLL